MENNALSKVAPEVLSKANPEPVDLIQARADVQANPAIKDLFRKADSEKWTDEQLATEVIESLSKVWPFGDPSEAVRYLVDEYRQLTPGVCIIDNNTGKVLAVLQEEDIYQPAMVPREGGGMVQPLKRIKPEIEGAIYLHLHDQAREKEILATLADRGNATELVLDNGDPRLLVATRKGRKHIVTELSRHDPKMLLSVAGGSTGTFVSMFDFGAPSKTHVDRGLRTLTGKVKSRTVVRIQDQTTINLHHNRAGALQVAMTNDWIRSLAKQLSLDAHERQTPSQEGKGSFILGKLVVVPPEMVATVRPLVSPATKILPVEGSKPVSLAGELGFLKMPSEFSARNFDAFDRWEVYSDLDFTMQYIEDLVFPFTLPEVEPEVQVL